MALLAFELPTMGVVPPPASSGAGSSSAAPPPSTDVSASGPATTIARSGSKKGKKSSKGGDSTGAGEAATASSSLPPMPAAISSLLDPSQRLRTAWELNAVILHAQGHASEPKLPGLMAIMNWGEGLLNEKGVDWPRCACDLFCSSVLLLVGDYGADLSIVACSTGDLHELLASKTAPSSAADTNGGDAAMAL